MECIAQDIKMFRTDLITEDRMKFNGRYLSVGMLCLLFALGFAQDRNSIMYSPTHTYTLEVIPPAKDTTGKVLERVGLRAITRRVWNNPDSGFVVIADTIVDPRVVLRVNPWHIVVSDTVDTLQIGVSAFIPDVWLFAKKPIWFTDSLLVAGTKPAPPDTMPKPPEDVPFIRCFRGTK